MVTVPNQDGHIKPVVAAPIKHEERKSRLLSMLKELVKGYYLILLVGVHMAVAANAATTYKEKFAYYQDYVKSCVQNIPQDAKQTVLVIGDLTDITGFGEKAYEAYWTDIAGLNYILPSNDGADKVNLTMEQVFEFDPDAVVVETFDTSVLTDDSTWLTLRAYKDGKVLAAPSALDNWSKPGAESMMVYLWALNVFYPDYSGELDLTTEIRNFYKDFYGYDMSEEYANVVLQGKDVAD